MSSSSAKQASAASPSSSNTGRRGRPAYLDSVQPPAKRRKVGDGSSANGSDGSVTSAPRTTIPPDSWLLKHYGGSEGVTLVFKDSNQSYLFPSKLLIENFGYFEGALRNNGDRPVFIEGQSRQFSFENITSDEFSRLLRYITKSETSIFQDCNDVLTLILTLCAGDYLGLKTMRSCTQYVAARLAAMLLIDRRKLKTSALYLVGGHNITSAGWANVIWKVLVKAGVRPFLQDYIGDEFDIEEKLDEIGYSGWLGRGHQNIQYWRLIVRHCRELMDRNDKYALDVATSVKETIKKGKLEPTTPIANKVLYLVDPLSEVDGLSSFSDDIDKRLLSRFLI